MARILLFDIDQTLLLAGYAGSRAMTRTFEELYGVSDAFRGVRFAGRTDQAILRDAFVNAGIAPGTPEQFAAALDAFKTIYYRRLEQALGAADGTRLLPGVVALLETLHAHEHAFLGLATGNFRRGAMLKLGHFGIDHYFIDGGFGDDAEDRAEMVAVAAQRLAGHVPPGDHEVYVFGDTAHDIEAARANGHVAIGVATGGSTAAELRASGAHHAFDDLSDLEAVLAVLGLDGR